MIPNSPTSPANHDNKTTEDMREALTTSGIVKQDDMIENPASSDKVKQTTKKVEKKHTKDKTDTKAHKKDKKATKVSKKDKDKKASKSKTEKKDNDDRRNDKCLRDVRDA